MQYAYRGLLSSATTRTDRDAHHSGATDRAAAHGTGSGALAVARASGPAGGWHDRGHAIHPSQSGGLSPTTESEARAGVPLCRIVGLLCLESGAVLNAAIGRYQGKGGDEQTLLRSILHTLEYGDLLLGDAFYATYFLLCTLRELGIDGVFEQYGHASTEPTFGADSG